MSSMLNSIDSVQRGWQIKIDRFETARNNYDFKNCCFRNHFVDNKALSNASSLQCASTASMSQASSLSGRRMSMGSALNIAASEEFMRFARRELKSATFDAADINEDSRPFTRLGNLLKTRSFRLDELAIDHLEMFGREKELQLLFEYGKQKQVRVVNVSGVSGSGKTVFAKKIQACYKNGVFCMGKFHVGNRAEPYQAIAEALEHLVRHLKEDSDRFSSCRDTVLERLGQSSDILAEIIPSFGIQIATGSPGKEESRNITHQRERINYAICEFLKAVCAADFPVGILLDDMQWSDPATLSLIEALFFDADLKNFTLLTTCRSDESEARNSQPFLKTLSDLDRASNGLLVKQLSLKALTVESVQQMVNSLLRMDHSNATECLARTVHQKTGGNPYFVLSFLQDLVNDKMLVHELGTMKWTWDELEIQSRNVAKNLAEITTLRLENLGQRELVLLQIASCLSRSVDYETLEFVVHGLQTRSMWCEVDLQGAFSKDLEETLAVLVEKGMLEYSPYSNRFCFSHDQILERTRSMIPVDMRIPLSVAIGRRLIEGMDDFRLGQFLYTAVNLCSQGLELFNEKDKKHFSFWAFLAGNSALKQGEFLSGLNYMELAMNCLGKNPLIFDPDLALPVYCGAVEASYCTQNLEKLEEYSRVVIQMQGIHAREKFRVFVAQIAVYGGNEQFQDAFLTGRNAINSMGIANLPKNPSTLYAMKQLLKTVKLMKRFGRKEILSLAENPDPAMVATMGLVVELSSVAFQTCPNFFLVMYMKAVRWTIKYGITKYSPVIISVFGILMTTALNNISEGVLYAEIAVELSSRYHSTLPLTISGVYGYVMHWKKPMHFLVSPLKYGSEVALKGGNITHAAWCQFSYTSLLVQASTSTLPEIYNEVDWCCRMLSDAGEEDMYQKMNCLRQFIVKLSDSNDVHPKTLDGQFVKLNDLRDCAVSKNNIILRAYIEYYVLQLLYHFGENPVIAADHGVKNTIGLGVTFAQGINVTARNTYFVGLASIAAYKQCRRRKYYRIAQRMNKRLSQWVRSGNPNCVHQFHLLSAEILSTSNKAKQIAEAEKLYKEAVTSSIRAGFTFDSALAYEKSSIFFANIQNDEDWACHQFDQAIKVYKENGAYNIVNHLKHVYPHLLPTAVISC